MTITRIGIQPDQQIRSCGLDLHQVLATIPGLTYRQLDFWTRTGRLKAHYHYSNGGRDILNNAGSGSDRCWPPQQVTIATRVYKLGLRGIQVDKAFTIATNPHVLAELLSELTKIQADLQGAVL